MSNAEAYSVIPYAFCEAKVRAKILAEKEFGPTDYSEPYKYMFVECEGCGNVLVGWSEYGYLSPEEEGWELPTREWPKPDREFDSSLPRAVRSSLLEATRCFQARAYMACAVMSGRAVEAVCVDKTRAKTFATGLNRLKEEKIIDAKLFEWGDALRKERNIGAHAGDEIITERDASDVLEFAIAISEYVYVLDEKYRQYKARKTRKLRIKRKRRKRST